MEFFLSILKLPNIYSQDAETHAAEDLTQALFNPNPTSSITTLGDNHTSALKHLAYIFNMVVPPQSKTPANTAMPQEYSPAPPPRVFTPEVTPEATSEPPPRLNTPGHISINLVRVNKPPPQEVPHMIPDNTEPKPPTAHRNTRGDPPVTSVHRYNTRAFLFQYQYLMANHVATINPLTPDPINPAPIMRHLEITGQ